MNPEDKPPESSAILDHLQTQKEIEDGELAARQEADAKHKKQHEDVVKREANVLASASENKGLESYSDIGDLNEPVGSQQEEAGEEGEENVQSMSAPEEEEELEEPPAVEVATVDEFYDCQDEEKMSAAAAEDDEPAVVPPTSDSHTNKPNTSTSPPKPKAPDIDHELVAKCLASNVELSPELVISIFDYGGQEVFDALHSLFLTPYGVYVCVFNMENLCYPGPDRDQGLAVLRKWLNSVVMHTAASGFAPVVFLGTHKDKVPDTTVHSDISRLLHESFDKHAIWPYVEYNAHGIVGNKTQTLAFFPIDNTKGRQDPCLGRMLDVVEKSLKEQDYINKTVPLRLVL